MSDILRELDGDELLLEDGSGSLLLELDAIAVPLIASATVLHTPLVVDEDTRLRVTQLPVEVLAKPSTVTLRLSQMPVEVLVLPLPFFETFRVHVID